MTAPVVTEKPSTVGFSYRARLQLWDRVNDPDGDRDKGKTVYHHMHLLGRVHPEPYNHATAVALTQQKIQPLLDLGWRIESLIVNAYDTKDA